MGNEGKLVNSLQQINRWNHAPVGKLQHLAIFVVIVLLPGRAKPMQPMQLHWVPSFWGPRAMVFGRLFIFAGYSLLPIIT